MAPIPSTVLPLSEKSTLPTSTSPQTKSKKRCPLSVTMRVSLLALFGLVYVGAALMPNTPCPGHMSAVQIPADAQAPAADASTLSAMLNAASPEHLHELLHSYLPGKYRHGVYESDRSAVEMLHKRDARLATTLVQMAKRQANSNSTTSAAPTTTETTAQTTLPSTTETSETSSAPSTSSAAPTTTTADVTSTTSAAPSSSSTTHSASSTTETHTTLSTATTSTTQSPVTTSASLTTFTSTDAAGNVEVITSTSMVVVHASHSSATASATHSADLQNAAVGTSPVTGMAMLAAAVAGLLAL